jgi:hypothetical protein
MAKVVGIDEQDKRATLLGRIAYADITAYALPAIGILENQMDAPVLRLQIGEKFAYAGARRGVIDNHQYPSIVTLFKHGTHCTPAQITRFAQRA